MSCCSRDLHPHTSRILSGRQHVHNVGEACGLRGVDVGTVLKGHLHGADGMLHDN